MEFFSWLERILRISDPHKKIEEFNKFYALFPNITFNHKSAIKIWQEPSYASICKIIEPKKLSAKRLGFWQKARLIVDKNYYLRFSTIIK